MTEALSVKIGIGDAGVVGGIAGASAALSEKVLNGILNTLKDFPIVTSMAKLFKALFMLLLYPLVPLLKPVLEKLRDFIVFMQPHMKSITDALTKRMESGTPSGGDMLGALMRGIESGNVWGSIALFIIDALRNAFEIIGIGIEGVWFGVKNAFQIIALGLQGAWFGLKSAWEVIKLGFQGIWFGVRSTFLLIMQPFIEFGNFIKSLTDTLPAFFKGALNAAIRIINRLPGVKIPYLAEGGIVNRPTLAMIGERGPEAVVPLGRGGGFGGMNITINSPTFSNRNDMEMLIRELERRMQINMRRHTSYTP